MDLFGDLAQQYGDFALDSRGGSPCFEEWASACAQDPEVLTWLAALPRLKQQPNLVFAAARWHGVPAPGPYAGLREALLHDDGRIAATVLQRSTQTNEVGRLATLVPLLAAVARQADGPLALVEVGASAGLCLFPDRHSYRWETAGGPVTVSPEVASSSGATLRCSVTGAAPLPQSPADLPRVSWRGGVDLNPLDVGDEDAMAWLETLVWPEEEDRRAQPARGRAGRTGRPAPAEARRPPRRPPGPRRRGRRPRRGRGVPQRGRRLPRPGAA